MYRYIYICVCNKYMDKYRVFTLIVFASPKKLLPRCYKGHGRPKGDTLGQVRLDLWIFEG